MEALEYHSADKSNWPDGPWMSEPDKKQWQDEATGLPCLIVRAVTGNLCGYVGVPKGHPYYGKEFDNIWDGIDVHGGLTFSGSCSKDHPQESSICHIPGEGESDDVWWLGFDIAHFGDMTCIAQHNYLKQAGLNPDLNLSGTYKDIEYVTKECQKLAEQLIVAECKQRAR